jgi:hypothetical protein
MHHLVALLAGCLLHPPADDLCREARAAQYEFLRSHGAENVEWNANGTVKHMKAAGIFLRYDIADLEAEDPAPQILEAIGPALLARGTEELRVRSMYRDPLTPGEVTVKLEQFIAGREVRWAYVNVVVLEQTNELKEVWAGFMPDRGLDHEPRLSPDEARAKAITTIKESFNRWQGATERDLLLSDDAPSDLLYEFEEVGASAILGGALVWVFSARAGDQGYRVNVDAATGKVVSVYPVNRF